MLVSALAGREHILHAYEEAIHENTDFQLWRGDLKRRKIMEERRRSKRTEISTLMVKRLDQGDMQEVSIDIVDVSPNGVAFEKEVLVSVQCMNRS